MTTLSLRAAAAIESALAEVDETEGREAVTAALLAIAAKRLRPSSQIKLTQEEVLRHVRRRLYSEATKSLLALAGAVAHHRSLDTAKVVYGRGVYGVVERTTRARFYVRSHNNADVTPVDCGDVLGGYTALYADVAGGGQ